MFTLARLFCLALLLFLLLASRANAADPWDPNRKFGGRLLILIAGPGEPGTSADPNLTEAISYYTYSNFHQFRRNDPNGAPSYSMVISSEPHLRAKLDRLPKRIKEVSGFLGVIPASIDSIHDLLSDDPKLSLIAKAISNFSKDANCQALMKAGGLTSVLPLIKTEIVIESHNEVELLIDPQNSALANLFEAKRREGSIPLWSTRSETGSLTEWRKKDRYPRLDQPLLSRLTAKLGEGVIQTFVDASHGTTIGENFLTKNQSSCYLSIADEYAENYIGALLPPTFAEMLPDHGQAIRSLKSGAPGAQNVAQMGAALLSRFERYRPGSEDLPRRGLAPIFSPSDHVSPLHSFVYNSADARAENVLNRCKTERVEEARAKALLKAGFTDALPRAVEISQDQRVSDPELDRVLTLTHRLRVAYAPYLEKIDLQPGKSAFAAEMQAFGNCVTSKSPKPEICGAISGLVNLAASGTATGGGPGEADKNLPKRAQELITEYESDAAPTLVAKYGNGEMTLGDLCKKLGSLWYKYEHFREELSSYADYYQKKHFKGELPAGLSAAETEMSKHFSNAFDAVQVELFPLLRREALAVRLARMEEAAKLLSLHGQELKGLDAREELRRLGNDLVCLTAYPVGPAFDARYGRK